MNDSPATSRSWYQFTLRELLVFALIVVLASVLLDSCRRGMGLLSDGEFAQRVARGDPLVQAVYDYKARTGTWPKELTATELAGVPEPDYRWQYQWRDEKTPPVLILSPIMHCTATYHFPNDSTPADRVENNWKISGESVRWESVKSTAVPPAR
jgi:hypothetical protein